MKSIDILEMQKAQQQYTDTLNLEICYSRLYSAYNARNRTLMLNLISYYQNHFPSNILEIKSKITNEFLSHNLPRPLFLSWIQPTDYEVELNVIGCMKAINDQLSYLNYYSDNYTFALKAIYEPGKPFEAQQVLNNDDKDKLTVADLLKVSKYAIDIAKTVAPDNEDFDKASAAISVFQGIDLALNNKPEDKPVNKMLHLAKDFLSSVVMPNVKERESKQTVSVGSVLVGLAIDFFCKK